MLWNWQQPDWPNFHYDKTLLEGKEAHFLLKAGTLVGLVRHINDNDRDSLTAELLSDEALKTSEIEGEILDRISVQSSIRCQLGLDTAATSAPQAEKGIAEMMVNLHHTCNKPLTEDVLFHWHELLMSGRSDIRRIGGYRTHPEAMQVVSGYLHKPKVHFEAPPSESIPLEMHRFIEWFNWTAPTGKTPLPALIRAGIAHLYFVCIHPFEDGNGRIGRAISEKTLAQCLGHPTLTLLATEIMNARKPYYDALERANKKNEITDWLVYFAQTILSAQESTIRRVEFIIAKTKLYDGLSGKLNPRQAKVLERMFREGPVGFKGGLSAENYITITQASRATTTRDLQELVEVGVLTRTGERRHTRYYLNLPSESLM